MTKQYNQQMQDLLKGFKKSNRLPNGFKSSFHNGILNETIHGNTNRTAGKIVGTIKKYLEPSYYIENKEKNIYFSISTYDGYISVIAGNEEQLISNWNECLEYGIKYGKEV